MFERCPLTWETDGDWVARLHARSLLSQYFQTYGESLKCEDSSRTADGRLSQSVTDTPAEE